MIKQGYDNFWLQKQIPILYSALWVIVHQLLIAFPSSYLKNVEAVCAMHYELRHKKRNRQEIGIRGDLRFLLRNIEPDINTPITSHQVHQVHQS